MVREAISRTTVGVLVAIVVVGAVSGLYLSGLLTPKPTIVTRSYDDASGDAYLKDLSVAPGYQDLTRSQISKQDGRFLFEADLAEAIPHSPPLVKNESVLEWFWLLDTDFTSKPVGFPVCSACSDPPEFDIALYWNGNSFSALLVDRRPLLGGLNATVSPLEFEINGTILKISVDSAVLGDPGSFRWGVFTEVRYSAPLETDYWFVDTLPDVAGRLTHPLSWP